MSWIAVLAAVLALTIGSVAPNAQAAGGRCRDRREWTTPPAEQDRMLALLNQARAKARRAPLRRSSVLDRMALAHATDMACRNYFDHTNRQRERLQDRLKRANDGSVKAWHRLAEIIGTSPTPQRQLERWLQSRGHRAAVLEAEHDRVGIGLVRIAGSRYGTYWAVEFIAEDR